MGKAKPLGKVISGQEFILKLEKAGQRFFALGNFLFERDNLGQIYYSNLRSEAHTLETFLDNHKARGNKVFAYFTELVACIRWIADTAHTLKHIQNRFEGYGVDEDEKLFTDIQNFVKFCNTALGDLYRSLKEEAVSLGIKFLPPQMEEKEFLQNEVQEYLVQDIDEVCCIPYEEKRITEVAFTYVDIAGKLSEFLQGGEPTEDKIEEFTSSFHRLQSKYDSYINSSEEERKDSQLRTLRGYVSVCLHLLETVFYMLHFYERHIKAESLREIKKRIPQIVAPSLVGENVNRMLEHARDYALKGDLLARKLLKEYAHVSLARERIIIPKGAILHLRPASALVEPVIQCSTPVMLEIDGKKVRPNSVLEIITAMGEVADKLETDDVEMVLQGDQKVVRRMKENFLSKILETKH